METMEAFSSHAVQVRVERAHTSGHINIMTQALQAEDGLTAGSYCTKYVHGAEKR